MNLYIWRHNRKFHSWSMLNEPCVHHSLYTDAIAIAVADSTEQALQLIDESGQGWLLEELRKLPPQIIELNSPSLLFSDIRCE